MSAPTDNNPRFGIEVHGINHIPEPERSLTVRQLRGSWLGMNLAPYIMILGIIGYTFGLQVWLLLVLLAAAIVLAYLAVGLGAIPGARTGIATMQVSIPPFGLGVGRVNAGLSWLVAICYEVINAVTGVFAALALFDLLGWAGAGDSQKVVALVVVFLLSVVVAFLGHATIVFLQRIAGVVLALATLALLLATLDDLDLGARIGNPLDTKTTVTLSIVFLGLAFATHSSYLALASDLSRYLPARSSIPSVVGATLIGAGIPAFVLGGTGLLLASRTERDLVTNPFDLEGSVPDVIFGVFLLAAVVGTVMNNALTVYSGGLCAQTTGLPLARSQAVLIDGVVATAGVGWILFVSDNVLNSLNDAIVFAIVWNGPWAAVWLTDAATKGWHVTETQILASRSRRQWPGVTAQLTGTVVGLLAISVPSYTGPIAEAFNGSDLSWIAGPLVAATTYLALRSVPTNTETVAPHA